MTAILHKSTLPSSLPRASSLSPSKPISFLGLSSTKSVLFGGFGPVRLGSKTKLVIKTSAFRNNNVTSEEMARFFEQEATVASSSTLDDLQGWEATLNRLSKWVAAVAFVAIILLRHDLGSLWFFMGSIINAILSIMLKRVFNQERPVATLRPDPGMPSNHAQAFSFIAVFAILSIVDWLGVNESSLILSAVVLTIGSYLSWLRVSQRLHTVSQVLVGAAVGSVFCTLWYWSWNAVMVEALISYPWVRVIVVLGTIAISVGYAMALQFMSMS
ncbi:hypothetical protein Tsubulata_000306 [Turnera subulata]|uniref:Phosphatidic acid phosphatase type 2/haloperoxidase domain-containing protein n=1 Tax=Turnera subulata TaxID=218843 RepID=A0A9Q0F157_9ROSI|nr:hypothetical protein Tsubulata_000306 [Turnera subulata]